MAPANSNRRAIPSPVSLLLIQSGGGILSLMAIATLPRFAHVSSDIYLTLLAGSGVNVLLSVALLVGQVRELGYYTETVGQMGEIGLLRSMVIYDTIMLGSLVMLTGGAEASAFGPQFAAILPVAMLVPDLPVWKWTYAGLFFLMFLAGLMFPPGSFAYIPDRPEKQIWLLVFFFMFTLFPASYSIQGEKHQL